MKLLVKNGADLNLVGKNGLTALQLAAFNNNQELANLLVENKADVNAKSNITANITAVNIVSLFGNQNIKNLLIQNGAECHFLDLDVLISHQKNFVNCALEVLKILSVEEKDCTFDLANSEPMLDAVNQEIANLFECMADYSVLDKNYWKA